MENATPTVYVVDDEPDVLRALSRLLRSVGLRVQTYDDAFTFLDVVDEAFNGCVVLDLSMPDLDGLAVQRLLAEKDCRLPVVFLTGNGDAVASATAMQQGAVAFLSKPVDAEVLLGAVRAALAGNAVADAGADGPGAR